METTAGSHVGKCLIEPKKFLLSLSVFGNLFYFVLKFVFWLLDTRFGPKGIVEIDVGVEETSCEQVNIRMTAVSDGPVQERLLRWLSVPKVKGRDEYLYPSRSAAIESFVVVAVESAFLKLCAVRFLRSNSQADTISSLVSRIRGILKRAKQSEKFGPVLGEVIRILTDITTASPETARAFCVKLCENMVDTNWTFYMELIHNHLRHENRSKHDCEMTMAVYALFFAAGSGPETWAIRLGKGIKTPEDMLLLSIVSDFVVGHCRLDVDVAVKGTDEQKMQKCGVEVILEKDMDAQFQRFVSSGMTMYSDLYRDKILYDIAINFSNDFIENAWSESTLERAIWTLQYGRRHMTKMCYRLMVKSSGRCKLDLTMFKGYQMLSFTIAGIVYAQGRGDRLYMELADPHAKIRLDGYLPKLTVGDLVLLGLMKEVQEGKFEMGDMPGSLKDRKYKAVCVGDRLLLVTSKVSVPFNAKLGQNIAF